MTKERPILFSGAMVRALLDGTKTQTRRIVKPQPADGVVYVNAAPGWTQPHIEIENFGAYGPLIACPYGQPGERLWVREMWRDQRGLIEYRADTQNHGPADGSKDAESVNWRPSIFMPRALSRITLEITGVRVERVQDISEADAKAEGVEPAPGNLWTPRQSFAALWDQINAERAPWAANPWVWVVEFTRI